jgi:rubredoxin---NAD+ reductase
MGDIVIIGSGIAGYSLATEIRKHDPDKKITIITANNGDYYYKPSISTALANSKDADSLVMFSAEAMATRLNINIITEQVVDGKELINGVITTANNGAIPFESCVIACGSETYKLKIAGNGADDVIAVNNLDDYRIFRERLSKTSKIAVIGAGLVGSEFAADLSSAGCDVTVFGDQEYPLHNLIPEQLAHVFIDAMQKNGVKWVFGDLVNQVVKSQNKYAISTENNDCHEGFDIVFSAIGIKPDITIAKQAGIEINKGICINNRCETSCDNIYAIGDCAEFENKLLPYIAPIKKCAAALGKTLIGDLAEFSYPPMPIVVKSPPCPILSCLPLNAKDCRISVDGSGTSLIIKYFDDSNNMKGFVLSGSEVKNRMACLAEIV